MAKSLFRIAATSIAVLGGINYYIDKLTDDDLDITKEIYHWKYGDISYSKVGYGEPLLLLHDLSIFSSGIEWSNIIEQLSEKYTLYIPDLPGCGASCKSEQIYTNYFYVQFLKSFIDDIIKVPVDVISTGKSSSFVIMAEFANKGLFKKIKMINPASLTNLREIPDRNSKIASKLLQLPIIGRTIYYIETNKENTELYFTDYGYNNPFHIDKRLVSSYYKNAHSVHGVGRFLLASIKGNYINADISRVLPSIENDITIIVGNNTKEKDRVLKEYESVVSNCKTVVIPNTCYLPQLEKPEELLNILQ